MDKVFKKNINICHLYGVKDLKNCCSELVPYKIICVSVGFRIRCRDLYKLFFIFIFLLLALNLFHIFQLEN